jgi:hypothetical protein
LSLKCLEPHSGKDSLLLLLLLPLFLLSLQHPGLLPTPLLSALGIPLLPPGPALLLLLAQPLPMLPLLKRRVGFLSRNKRQEVGLSSRSKKKIPCFGKEKVNRDVTAIQKNSANTSFHTRRYTDILRNQLVRAHSHSLLELALKFEGFRKKNPHNQDPEWFLEKASVDFFLVL